MNSTARLTVVVAAWMLVSALGSLASAEVRTVRDVAYKTAAKTEYEQQRCKLDLYLPEKATGFPTIVWFHGGGLQTGDKASEIAVKVGQRFAGNGIAVASVNYRLSPKVYFPEYIDDAAAAVAFVHQTISQHGGSPERIFVSGHSAGGYLTAMVGLDARYLQRHGLTPQQLAGCMPVSGQMITHSTIRRERGLDARPLIDEAAPAWHVSANAPPFLCIAGGDDLPTRAEENRYFAAAMKLAGHQNTTYAEFAGRTHNTVASQMNEPDDAVAQKMLEFIKQVGSAKSSPAKVNP
jgi:acetyl esterase/lipase